MCQVLSAQHTVDSSWSFVIHQWLMRDFFFEKGNAEFMGTISITAAHINKVSILAK